MKRGLPALACTALLAGCQSVPLPPLDAVTVIGRQKRDYVWGMARTPRIPQPHDQAFVQRVAAWGYDVTKLHRVPQQWEGAA